MSTIHTFDSNSNRPVTFSQNSGLLFASDPFNYTMNAASGLIISSWSVMGDIHVLDNLSDEIGITHEAVNGEIVENSINE